LAEKRFLYVPVYNFQAMGSFKPITALYYALIIKPRNFAKRQSDSVNYSYKPRLHAPFKTPPFFQPMRDVSF